MDVGSPHTAPMTPHDGTSDRPDVGAEIVEAFGRVYRQIRREMEGLDERELRWRPAPNTTPIANIVLHVIAATRVHLSALCGGPYERDREAEFAASPLDADDLVQLLEEA